jgi:soluble lytic murein transglycosylase-like protein
MPAGGGAENPSESGKYSERREKGDLLLDMREFTDRLDRNEAVSETEWRKFEQNLKQWEKTGDVESIRKAGVKANENSADYLKRHGLLSKAFLSKTPEAGLRFKVDFKGNELAEWKVGAGDMLPPNVLTINVYRNGVSTSAIRGRNPQTGRIGYYEENALKRKQYDYVAVHTGDEIEITGTEKVPPMGTRRILAEQIGVYQQGAVDDAASEGDEVRYDAKEHKKYPDIETALSARKEKATITARESLAALGSEVALPVTGDATIEGKQYQKANRDFWTQEVGASEAEAKRWIATEDPVTGKQLTFLGCPIPGGTNILILPYLKEAEARIKAAGINYKIHQATSTAWRKVRGSTTGSLSYHSWGAAIDLNPETNGLGSTTTDIPPQVISIMESVGFKWGGQWGRPDPMHFEFKLNPYTSGDLLTSSVAKKYHASAEKFSGGRMKQYAQAMEAIRKQPMASTNPSPSLESKPGFTLDTRLNAKIDGALDKYKSIIDAASAKYGVPTNLIKAVIFQESGGNPIICSGVGAGGLMQLMPATAKGLGLSEIYQTIREKSANGKVSYRLDQRDERSDPEKNIMAGTQLLGQLLKQYNGNIENALAGYNWGSGNMDKYLRGEKKMPSETAQYINRIPKMYASLSKADTSATFTSRTPQINT